MHSPYSFSAFDSIDQALDMAAAENVSVVGINDFFTTEGYPDWDAGCRKRSLYPLFNIEFIGLNQEDQKAGIRINDPGNPGRIYISGKGLSFPFRLPEPHASGLNEVVKEANDQVKKMCIKLNEWLILKEAGFQLDVNDIISTYTKGLLRERHLAKALRIRVYERCKGNETCVREQFNSLFGGKDLKTAITDFAGVENEIRANLLKAGGAAFVPEDPRAFLPMQTVCDMIVAGGGIPTYPFLADDAKGHYTDFEGDLEKVEKELSNRGFASVEFISPRNDLFLLEKYADYLDKKGFIVTLGTEHNTPAMEPIEPFARNGVALSENLKRISYEGVCVIAAHQDRIKKGLEGYLDKNGKAHRDKKNEFISLGDQIINAVVR